MPDALTETRQIETFIPLKTAKENNPSTEQAPLAESLDLLYKTHREFIKDNTRHQDNFPDFVIEVMDILSHGTEATKHPKYKHVVPILKRVLERYGKEHILSLKASAKAFHDIFKLSELQDRIDKGDRTKEDRRKTTLAAYQQRLAKYIFSLTNQGPDSPEVQGFQTMYRFIKGLSDYYDESILHTALKMLQGALTQAVLMKEYIDNGFFVIVPDYRDLYEIEIMDRKGVDFVAISKEGAVYFIDAKASANPILRRNFKERVFNRRTRNYIFMCLQKPEWNQHEHEGLQTVLETIKNRSVGSFKPKGLEVTSKTPSIHDIILPK